jgi:hypothetical protein
VGVQVPEIIIISDNGNKDENGEEEGVVEIPSVSTDIGVGIEN